MKYRILGKTGITVSAVAMGCWAFAGDSTWGSQSEADSIATVRAALDAGVSLFDTAEGYGGGDSESVLGRALAGCRHEAVIATKVSRSNLSGQALEEACQHSLRRLQTDYIDIYQIHWPNPKIPLEETWEALRRLQEQGKVRAIGVCNFGVSDLSDLLALGWVETNQLPYSLLWRAIEYGIRQKCIEEGIGVLCYSPLVQGLLTGKFYSPDEVPEGRARTRLFSRDRPQARHNEAGCETEVFSAIEKIRHICDEIEQPMASISLAWLLHQPGVASAVVGARTPHQIEETAQAADLELAPAVIDELTAATETVKQKMGPNPDMWQAESRFR